MAVDLIVVRAPGDRPGPDIVEGILANASIALIRGTTEINDSEPTIRVSLSTKYRDGVRKGQMVEVLDELQGKVWRGKITGITHTVQGADIWTDLDIDRPSRYY